MFERGSKSCVLVSIPDIKRKTIILIIEKYFYPGPKIITDCWISYSTLSKNNNYNYQYQKNKGERERENKGKIKGKGGWDDVKPLPVTVTIRGGVG